MKRPKLIKRKHIVIPDIIIHDEDGKEFKNRDLPKSERVEAEVTYANPEERMQYLGSRHENKINSATKKATNITYSEIRMEDCIRKHVRSIRGCLSEWYRDGNSLWDGEESKVKDALIMSLFYRILGLEDGEEEPFEVDGPGNLKPGESLA